MSLLPRPDPRGPCGCMLGHCRSAPGCRHGAVPNAATVAALEELERGGGEVYCQPTGPAWCKAATITASGPCDDCPAEAAPMPARRLELAPKMRQPLKAAPARVLPTDSASRKTYPMAAGLLDYFPDALAAIAHVSYLGNEKHNPGEPLHHARGKSMDHADCIIRHLLNRGGFDGDVRESAAMAWRALALLQEELERDMRLPLPRGARSAT